LECAEYLLQQKQTTVFEFKSEPQAGVSQRPPWCLSWLHYLLRTIEVWPWSKTSDWRMWQRANATTRSRAFGAKWQLSEARTFYVTCEDGVSCRRSRYVAKTVLCDAWMANYLGKSSTDPTRHNKILFTEL